MTDKTNPKDLLGSAKPPISLVPGSVIIHLANAFRNGAEKYGAYNWRTTKVKQSIYLDAAMRHIIAYNDGEDNASDSGVSHLAHAIASLGVLLDANETGNSVDDRPKKGNSAELLDKFTKKVTPTVVGASVMSFQAGKCNNKNCWYCRG